MNRVEKIHKVIKMKRDFVVIPECLFIWESIGNILLSLLQNLVSILIGIVLNLWIYWGRTDSFTLLSHHSQDPGMSLSFLLCSQCNFKFFLYIGLHIFKFVPKFFFINIISEIFSSITLYYLTLFIYRKAMSPPR